MLSLLLAIIYMAFISLGLPDSLLGSAWPVMRIDFGAELSFVGVISMIIAAGTIVSSLLSERVTRRLGTAAVTALSVALTAAALFGFSFSSSALQLCLWAVPYGLGAGAIDAALNNFVALHYSSRHMSWLHCFWGVGASISPYIMSAVLTRSGSWQAGYRTVGVIQVILTALLFLSLPLWRTVREEGGREEGETAPLLGLRGSLRIGGVPLILAAFCAYCGAETTAGLWASSYLVGVRGISPETAASFASLFYLGITFGRFLNGFAADRMGDRRMIRIGVGVMAFGIVLILLPLRADIPSLAGLVIFGLGCAPVYPSIIHSTPANFGRENSQAIIGVQMASAYVGSTFMPPLFGLVAQRLSLRLFPVYLAVLLAVLLLMTEGLNRLKAKEPSA
ncbi:MAG: MFS transporter [Oscillospiraceae bacterium]|nr:MFS transporter [Oscillospiraceae bacterium]